MFPLSPYKPTQSSQALLWWSRFAAFLSFVALLSALWAPVSMLAQDVQSGKLGGVCSLNNFAATSSSVDGAAAGSSSAQPKGAHCDLCGSLGLTLVVLPLFFIPTFPGSRVAAITFTVDPAGPIPGLPPGRGPPAV